MPRLDRHLVHQLGWFVAIGGAATAVQFGAYLGLTEIFGVTAASVLSWLVATLLANAAHRSITFSDETSHSAAADHVVALLSCLAGLLLTTLVLDLTSGSGAGGTAVIVVALNAVIGAGRFVLMRWWLAPRTGHAPVLVSAGPSVSASTELPVPVSAERPVAVSVAVPVLPTGTKSQSEQKIECPRLNRFVRAEGLKRTDRRSRNSVTHRPTQQCRRQRRREHATPVGV